MSIKFSIALQGSYPIRDYIDKAKRIEQYDFDELHVYDDLMFKPTWPLLTLIGEHTSRIKVGPGIITPQIVHPCYHAGNLAELDELTNGRAVLGIARGAFWEFLGIEKQRKPITMVREAIHIIRRLLSGDHTTLSRSAEIELKGPAIISTSSGLRFTRAAPISIFSRIILT